MIGNSVATGKTHFLYPAAIFVSREAYLVSTILGSCISICLWDSRMKAGGINHFILPLWNGQGLASPKYGNISITKMIEKMKLMGCRVEELKAKIFGGGELLQTNNPQFNIGQRNIELARMMLSDACIPVMSSNTGGKQGRKILFNTLTGEVKHKFIQSQVYE